MESELGVSEDIHPVKSEDHNVSRKSLEDAPSVFAVVVGYGNKKELVSTAQHLLALPYCNLSVIAVDNDEGEPERVTKIGERLELVCTGLNRGFASACNVGICLALERNAKFVFLLNDDAMAVADCIDRMVKSLTKNPNIGLACPIVFSEGLMAVEAAGGWFNRWVSLTLHNKVVKPQDGVSSTDVKVDFAPGVALMVRVDALKKVGFLDTRYFMYLEDLDLSIRMKRAGYSVVCVAEAYVSHITSSTSKRYPGLKEYYMMRNRFILCLLLKRRIQLVTVALSTPWVLLLRVLRKLPHPDLDELKGLYYGIVDGMKLNYGPSSREAYTPSIPD